MGCSNLSLIVEIVEDMCRCLSVDVEVSCNASLQPILGLKIQSHTFGVFGSEGNNFDPFPVVERVMLGNE